MAAEYVCCSMTSPFLRTPSTANQKIWTLTTANRMLRNWEEDIRFCYDIAYVGNRTINMTYAILFIVGNKTL